MGPVSKPDQACCLFIKTLHTLDSTASQPAISEAPATSTITHFKISSCNIGPKPELQPHCQSAQALHTLVITERKRRRRRRGRGRGGGGRGGGRGVTDTAFKHTQVGSLLMKAQSQRGCCRLWASWASAPLQQSLQSLPA